MKSVLWRPEMNLPSELTMVQTKPGKLTRNQWLEALADRVQSMVMASEDPALWMRLAAKEMDLPTLEPKAAGQLLVLHNLALQTAFNLHDLETWPAVAKNNALEPEILNDLESWILAAAAVMR